MQRCGPSAAGAGPFRLLGQRQDHSSVRRDESVDHFDVRLRVRPRAEIHRERHTIGADSPEVLQHSRVAAPTPWPVAQQEQALVIDRDDHQLATGRSLE